MWLHYGSEGGWKEDKFFSCYAVDGGVWGTVIGENVTSNKSARVNRVNECLNWDYIQNTLCTGSGGCE
jgi:hypothetical protein